MDLFEERLRDWFRLGFPRSLQTALDLGLSEVETGTDAASDRSAFAALRELCERANRRQEPSLPGAGLLDPETVIALSLVTDAMRYLLEHYCHREHPGVIERSLEQARQHLWAEPLDEIPDAFTTLFPPTPLLASDWPVDEFLAATRSGISNRDTAVTEIILLHLLHRNPATRACRRLFDDTELRRRVSVVPLVICLEEFFDSEPPTEAASMTLFHTLRAPMRACPGNLAGQLAYIRRHWASLLPQYLVEQMHLAADVLRERTQVRGMGPGETPVLEFRSARSDAERFPEREAFSRDADWMSNVVLMAKSAYVWLDQLSKWHGREISRLDQVPDEELDRLARSGMTGLWLIGLWERSPASRTLKRWLGNTEAEASAYSLREYSIAADLGGEDAWRDLSERAGARGIRLASDMVPNHMGLDSTWMAEHPEWFLGEEQPPFPWYTFGGGDLSSDDRMSVYIEDGYWERRDAAVVCKRVDRRTGAERFIYHGNDGTSMPWNDTAQLDYLQAEVREAVIQVILDVARRFPIIRFDAAMTLARKHYQRLWFPLPGEGGAIPSRAERSLTAEDFDRAFPVEFWREVVDRVAAEVPDTLLLAEAFWLMEGYFVRTLGMHRVYNSAFMNMLKMEENAKYRQTIRNVLEFSPEVLNRFVNFMNNPDERTAVEQFGKGDKYFGVAVMMSTMPGLPMFGHGQIEGFAEKYGMEFRRAAWDEPIDEEMVRRHEAEIFPLLHRRRLFSGAKHFRLYDFMGDGGVNENVFAWTNRSGDEPSLVLVNNSYERATGSIAVSCPVNIDTADAPRLSVAHVAGALGVEKGDDVYVAWREHRSGLEFLRRGRDLWREGYVVKLQGYEYQVLLDIRAWHDADGPTAALCDRLDGRGVPSLDEAGRELELEPLLAPFAAIFDTDGAALAVRVGAFLLAAAGRLGRKTAQLATIEVPDDLAPTGRRDDDADDVGRVLLGRFVMRELVRMAGDERTAASLGERWLLRRRLAEIFAGGDGDADGDAALVMLLTDAPEGLLLTDGDTGTKLADFLETPAARDCLQVHEFESKEWFGRERFERLVLALETIEAEDDDETVAARAETLRTAAEASGWIFPDFLESLRQAETG